MTVTLLDLYNTAASQEWAMYDDDAGSDGEFENSLVIALNKAIIQIYSSFDFPFRERTHLILTIPNTDSYEMPKGIIKRDTYGRQIVKCNSSYLEYIENPSELKPKFGVPEGFYIQNESLVLYPCPSEKMIVSVEYMTLVVGETPDGEELYSLHNDTDILLVPTHLEELMKEAVITRTMLNTIASEKDENFSAYQKQAENAYRLLIKYSKGVKRDKSVRF